MYWDSLLKQRERNEKQQLFPLQAVTSTQEKQGISQNRIDGPCDVYVHQAARPGDGMRERRSQQKLIGHTQWVEGEECTVTWRVTERPGVLTGPLVLDLNGSMGDSDTVWSWGLSTDVGIQTPGLKGWCESSSSSAKVEAAEVSEFPKLALVTGLNSPLYQGTQLWATGRKKQKDWEMHIL